MRIFLVNNHHFLLGGAERYYLTLGTLLKKNGNKVAYFSTQDLRNQPSRWSRFFIKKIDTAGFRPQNVFRVLSGIFYSFEARRNIKKLLDEFKPEVVHLNNIYFRISPSVIFEIVNRNLPIVETVHDYHPISPNVNLYHGGAICELTKTREYYKAIIHKCVKDSYLISFFVSIAFYLYDYWGIYRKKIDVFIAPSKFMKKKLTEYGLKDSKIIYLPNFIQTGKLRISNQEVGRNSYVLFFGVLLKHKGLPVLLRAARLLPDISFKIAGDGPEEDNLKRLSKRLKLRNVEFLGRLNEIKLWKTILQSQFCVVPSLWYENMPYSILEAFSFGRPVIASRIGGIPEIVNDGDNGILFKPGDAVDLAKKIEKLWQNTKKTRKMGEKARKDVEKKYAPDIYYKKLMGIYKMAIKNKKTN